MRPRQWSKNVVVLAAVVFARAYVRPEAVAAALAALGLFVLASGCLYLLNDVADRERDRLHPEKRFRPVAAGLAPTSLAVAVGVAGVAVALALGFALHWPFGVVLAGYVALQLAYSWGLKHLVIIDLLAIAGGFVLRAV
ncbi:MAG: UbiA family prenyltransferase, partial [Actinobacteria bacterium]|nr:UbiA family prenyltransferase [Actinomycetota bacterium]